MSKENGLEIRIAGGMRAVGERNGVIVAFEGYGIALDWGQKIPEFGSAYEQGEMMEKLGSELPDEYFPDISQAEGLNVELLCLTHGHQDHTEGWWKLRERNNKLMVATHLFTAKVLNMRADKAFLEPPSTFMLAENMRAGPFKIRRFEVNHSIPGASGFLLEAGDRRVVHPGDVKSWPIHGGVDKNMEMFGPLVAEGPVDYLFLDATNALEPGFVISEDLVREMIKYELSRAKGRVFFATISSNVRRQDAAISAAIELGKPVIVIGGSMRDFLGLANITGWTAGYQRMVRGDDGEFSGMRQITPDPSLWPDDAVICVSGSQGEPLSFLDNWAEGRFRLPRKDGDILIVSQDTIPLPEIEERFARAMEKISGKVDQIHLPEATPEFASQGAEVHRDSAWHASGHGMQGDLKLLLEVFKPRFFTPCHADRERREALAALGEAWGAEWGCQALLLDDGERMVI